MLQTYLATVAIHWQRGPLSTEDRYEKLENLRHLAQQNGLLLQEEARSVASALFSQPHQIIHLGLEQVEAVTTDWYSEAHHAQLQAISAILDDLATWPDLSQMAFLISNGSDPFSGLQVNLSHQMFHRGNPTEDVKPSDLAGTLETQRIYVFSNHIPGD